MSHKAEDLPRALARAADMARATLPLERALAGNDVDEAIGYCVVAQSNPNKPTVRWPTEVCARAGLRGDSIKRPRPQDVEID